MNIPIEVQEAIAIRMMGQSGIGLSLYERHNEIVEKYPEWFTWEHKWKSIPEHVHKKYLEDSSKAADRHYKKVEKERNQLKEKDIERNKLLEKGKFTLQYLDNLFEYVREQDNLSRKQKKRWTRTDKRIWNKHYKKYDLEYRK